MKMLTMNKITRDWSFGYLEGPILSHGSIIFFKAIISSAKSGWP